MKKVTYSIRWNLDNSNCKGPGKGLSYERFELWVMLSLCFNHVTTVASPFCSSVFHFLAKQFKICEIFFSCVKKTMKLSLLRNNVNTSSHIKGNLMALTIVYQFELWLKIRDMPGKLSLPRQGPWSLVWVRWVFKLSEVEVTDFTVLGFLIVNSSWSWCCTNSYCQLVQNFGLSR